MGEIQKGDPYYNLSREQGNNHLVVNQKGALIYTQNSRLRRLRALTPNRHPQERPLIYGDSNLRTLPTWSLAHLDNLTPGVVLLGFVELRLAGNEAPSKVLGSL